MSAKVTKLKSTTETKSTAVPAFNSLVAQEDLRIAARSLSDMTCSALNIEEGIPGTDELLIAINSVARLLELAASLDTDVAKVARS